MNYDKAITLDFAAQGCVARIEAKQGDAFTRRLIVTLKMAGQAFTVPEGVEVLLRVQKPDGTAAVNQATVNDNGTVTVILTDQILAAAGPAFCDLALIREGELLSTVCFGMDIQRMPGVENQMESSSEWLWLLEKLAQASENARNAQEAAESAQAAQSAAETASTAAQGAASTATAKAGEAATSATNAAQSATDAETAQGAAESARDTAQTAAQSASTSATAASTAQTAAEAAQGLAEIAEGNAEQYASTATTKAAEAATSESNAFNYQQATKEYRDETEAMLDDLVKYDNDEFASPLPFNADQLNGHPDTYFAKQEDMSAAEEDIASLRMSINDKYVKPSSGIPKADLAPDVQSSLGKADSALQEHQSLSAYRTASEQDVIDAQKYSASNPPPYPVTSVNGQTGGVVLNYITYDEEEE